LLVGLTGYRGPSAAGLLAAKLIEIGHPVAVLWLAFLMIGLLLLVARNLFAVGVALISGVVIYVAIRYMPVSRETVLSYGIAWFLLLAGLRDVMVHRTSAGDAHGLSGLTHLPRQLWMLLWLIGTGAALYIGGRMLI
jgi:Peptidase M50B-like